MALALSVWARKSHEVILATYTVFIVGMLIWPIWYSLTLGWSVSPSPAWTLLANPFYVAFAPYFDPGKLEFWDYFLFFGVAFGAAAVLSLLAVWRTRPVACRGSVGDEQGRTTRPGRPSEAMAAPSVAGL